MKRVIGVLVIVLMAVPAPAQAPVIDLAKAIFRASQNAVLRATVTPATGWTSSRVYFRAAGTEDYYYVEMNPEGAGEYSAILPKVAEATTAVEYYVEARQSDGTVLTSAVRAEPVADGPAVMLTVEQTQAAMNMVVGETVPSQAGQFVAGFQCDGIIARMSSSGSLVLDNACGQQMMAKAAEAAGLGGMASPSDAAFLGRLPLWLVAGVSAAVAATTIAILAAGEEASPSTP